MAWAMAKIDTLELFDDIPQDWEMTTLGDICERGGGSIQTGPFGSQLHASDYVAAGIPSIMPSDIVNSRISTKSIAMISEKDAERLSRHRVKAGNIVFSRRGDVTLRTLIRKEQEGWLCGTGSLKIDLGNDVVEPLFASLYFGHPDVKDWIVRHAVGSTMPNLNGKIMGSVPFLLPPLPEQRAIARILGALDDKIELNRRMNQTLEAMAQALFKSWFVDFDPVTAKSEGRIPCGMSAEMAALFPAEFVDSDLGAIPKGWNVDKVSKICTTQYGYTASASENPVGSKFLRITDINKEPWIEWGNVPYCEVTETNKTKYLLSIGDILVSRMADPGKAGIVEQEIDAVFASYLVRLKAKNLDWAYYLFYFLRSEQYLDYADGVKSGSVQLGMNAKVIVDADMILPPEPLVNKFFLQVQPLRKKIVSNLQESSMLASIRDALLPRLLSGEVRVKG